MVKSDTTFNIFGVTWTIKLCDRIDATSEESFKFGEADTTNKVVSIARLKPDGSKFTQRELELTMLHELFHAILSEGQYLTSCADEPLVEWLAKSVLSLKEQGILK